ncbi:MAG: hypothetical protein QM710_02875 [Flavobacterium sp.]
MDLKKYLIWGIFICWNFSFACECKPQRIETLVQRGLSFADIIFYGEVIQTDTINQTYTFKIIELFKGKYTSRIIKGDAKTSCSVSPNKNEFWIVYASLGKDKSIDISMCSPSQTIYGGGYNPGPPPHDPAIMDPQLSKIMNRIYELEYTNKGLSNWVYQIEKLRQYKLVQNTITEKSKSDFKDKLIIGSLIANALLLLTIIGLIVSKKSSNNRITQ